MKFLDRYLYPVLFCFLFATSAAWAFQRIEVWQGAGVISSSNPMYVTGTTTSSGTGDVNVKQIGGTTTDTNSGSKSAGTQRVVLATDQPQLTNALKVEPAGNVASGATDSGNPIKVGAVYNSTLPTFTNGQRGDAQVGTRGSIHTELWGSDAATAITSQSTSADGIAATATANKISTIGYPFLFNGTTWDRQPGNTTGAFTVGNAASGVADSGNPVKVGGIYNSTLPTFTNGQRGDAQLGTRGSVHVELWASDSNSPVTVAAGNADGLAQAGVLGPSTRSLNYNIPNGGVTWDRQFTCSASAVINVTAGNTTELVALTASQVIRVCSFVLTESLAGSATFVYGTGTNCATGQTGLTGVMVMATSGTMALSAGNSSLFRTASANALCLTAVTGNITGFVSYAKF